MSFDPLQFKQAFPLFQQPENQSLVYLDNAATTQRPASVIDAISHFYIHQNANAHRASHRLGRLATTMLEDCRARAAQFLGAEFDDDVIFCRGATEALNLLAYSLCAGFSAGDEIILSVAEHHANLVPWQLAAQRHGLALRFLPLRHGAPDLTELPGLLTRRTRLVSITAASNALGALTNFGTTGALLAAQGIPWIVDAAQLAAHAPLNVAAIGCDFLVCSAHKFYGPTGIGLLYGRRDRLASLPPWQAGGEMIRSVSLEQSVFAEPPQRFETGTASLGAIAGLHACLDFLAAQDREGMQIHERALSDYLHQRLRERPRVRLLTRAENNLGIANFQLEAGAQFHAADLADWLDQRDIAVRMGRHCAQPLMTSLGVDASLRVSLAAYNSRDDVDQLLYALDEALAHLPAPSSVRGYKAETLTPIAADASDDVSAETLARATSWQAKQRLLMRWGECVQPKPAIRSKANQVKGCEAATWIYHWQEQGRHRFAVDSEARIVRGLAALLLSWIDGQDDATLAALDVTAAFEALGLARHLSPSRVNGFRALLERAWQLAGVARQ